jgi:short-subunit dehydrogenase
MDRNSRSKNILITGASEGIGAALAWRLHERGYRLALCSRNEAKLRAEAPPGAVIYRADLSDTEERERLKRQLDEEFGPLYGLINNAGRGLYVPAWRASMEDVRGLFELNFFAAYDLAQWAARSMAGRGGMLVNISSVLGLFSCPWSSVYAASKFALAGLSDGLRMELASQGVHVLTVYPGYVQTGFQTNVVSGAAPTKLKQMRGFSTTPDRCAAAIVRGMEGKRRTLVVPSYYRLAVLASQWMPGLFERWMEASYREMEDELLSER